MKVYITKYALTKGIIEAEVKREHQDRTTVIVAWPGGLSGEAMFFQDEWYHAHVAAVARAEEMRKAKIQSLKRQIARLEKLRFEEVE